MGLGVQPCNYTFSLWPSNCKPSILTSKVWDHWGSMDTPWQSGRSGPTRHLSRACSARAVCPEAGRQRKEPLTQLPGSCLPRSRRVGGAGGWGGGHSLVFSASCNASMHCEAPPRAAGPAQKLTVLEGAHLTCRGFGGLVVWRQESHAPGGDALLKCQVSTIWESSLRISESAHVLPPPAQGSTPIYHKICLLFLSAIPGTL